MMIVTPALHYQRCLVQPLYRESVQKERHSSGAEIQHQRAKGFISKKSEPIANCHTKSSRTST